MKRKSLYFVGPGQVDIREEELGAPGAGEVLVRGLGSLISAGTEMLLYRGEMPEGMQSDEMLPALQGLLRYPLKYGYSMVGEVLEAGPEVDAQWRGKRVFAFNPHESAFIASVDDLQTLPEGCETEDAAFLANMETAVNLMLEAGARLGERVVVIGQGVLGLLCTALLARHPLGALLTVEPVAGRRKLSEALGAEQSLGAEALEAVRERLGPRGADLVIELSGRPEALTEALELVGREGRVVVGSWYGTRQAALGLGGRFHREHIQLISSHVGTIPPGLRGRWDRARRFEQAWEMVAALRPGQLVTHRFGIEAAGEAYGMLDLDGEGAMGVVISYQ